jgi:hypothetical protein
MTIITSLLLHSTVLEMLTASFSSAHILSSHTIEVAHCMENTAGDCRFEPEDQIR